MEIKLSEFYYVIVLDVQSLGRKMNKQTNKKDYTTSTANIDNDNDTSDVIIYKYLQITQQYSSSIYVFLNFSLVYRTILLDIG